MYAKDQPQVGGYVGQQDPYGQQLPPPPGGQPMYGQPNQPVMQQQQPMVGGYQQQPMQQQPMGMQQQPMQQQPVMIGQANPVGGPVQTGGNMSQQQVYPQNQGMAMGGAAPMGGAVMGGAAVLAVQKGNVTAASMAGPLNITCTNCGQTTITRKDEDQFNIYLFLWCLFCGIIGIIGYLFCCKDSHGYKHYCMNCGHLQYTKEAECLGNSEARYYQL